jgi:hypothetical protein
LLYDLDDEIHADLSVILLLFYSTKDYQLADFKIISWSQFHLSREDGTLRKERNAAVKHMVKSSLKSGREH